MSSFEDEPIAHRFDRYGREISGGGGPPGRATVTSRMPASARSIARAVASALHGGAPDAETLVSRAATGAGQALPDALRGRFEASLGADLGGVRVHTDGAAADAAAALGARAYATGQDVFMGAGQYAPDSADGALLLAHEVAHTVQQADGAGAPRCKLDVSSPGDASEHEADVAAVAMLQGTPASVSRASGATRRAIRRWVDAGIAGAIVQRIDAAELGTIQPIILGLETARASATARDGQVPLRIPGLSLLVPVADLDALDARARGRFHELSARGPAATPAPAPSPAAPEASASAPEASVPAPAASPAGPASAAPAPAAAPEPRSSPLLPTFRYSAEAIPVSIASIETPDATITFRLELRGQLTATPPRPLPGVSIDQNGLRVEASQRIGELTSGLRISSIGSGNATIGNTMSGPLGSTEARFEPPSTYHFIRMPNPINARIGGWTVGGSLGFSLRATVVPHPRAPDAPATPVTPPTPAPIHESSWWERNHNYVIGTVVVVGAVAIALTGVGAIAEGTGGGALLAAGAL